MTLPYCQRLRIRCYGPESKRIGHSDLKRIGSIHRSAVSISKAFRASFTETSLTRVVGISSEPEHHSRLRFLSGLPSPFPFFFDLLMSSFMAGGVDVEHDALPEFSDLHHLIRQLGHHRIEDGLFCFGVRHWEEEGLSVPLPAVA